MHTVMVMTGTMCLIADRPTNAVGPMRCPVHLGSLLGAISCHIRISVGGAPLPLVVFGEAPGLVARHAALPGTFAPWSSEPGR